MLMYATWIILATFIALGYYLASRGKRVINEMSKATGFMAKFSLIFETLDLVKDWIYFFTFRHSQWAIITLLISITLPFGIMHSVITLDKTPTFHALTIFLGLTFSKGQIQFRFMSNVLV